MIHEFLMHLVDKLLENPDIESEKDVSYDEIEKSLKRNWNQRLRVFITQQRVELFHSSPTYCTA